MPHSKQNSTSSTGQQNRMSRLSSTSTYSGGNAFPKPAGATLSPEQGTDEKSSTQFSFPSSPHSMNENDADLKKLRSFSRGTGSHRPSVASRSRHQFYEDSFLYKDSGATSARDRVTKDAPVVAELRTNVIIKDEYTLVTDLSHHLSTRYQRPESSIMITVNHSACLLLGGSFEPTYVLTINALPSQVQPTTNKRNAALISTFMAESIGVTPDRGIIRFTPIPEESLATNGMTMLGEIERLEQIHGEENASNIKKAINRRKSSAVSKAKSSIALSRKASKAVNDTSIITTAIPDDGPADSAIGVDEKGMGVSPTDRKASGALPGAERKKSEPLLSKFTKRSESNAQMVPPPIPDEKSPPTMTKRKSIFSMFHR